MDPATLLPLLLASTETDTGARAMAWYIPVLIFCARICDVSIGTVRTILVITGHRYTSAALGFFEVTIWVLAVGGVIAYLSNPIALIAYAGGFATGVIVGMGIEDRIALGYRVVRAISPRLDVNLSERMREHGYRVTRVDGKGRSGPVEIAFMVIRRRELAQVRKLVDEIDPKAFISIERADRPSGGVFNSESRFAKRPWSRLTQVRK